MTRGGTHRRSGGPRKAEGGAGRAPGAKAAAATTEAAVSAVAGPVDAPAAEGAATERHATETTTAVHAAAATVAAGRPAHEAGATWAAGGAPGGHERELTTRGCAVDGGRARATEAELGLYRLCSRSVARAAWMLARACASSDTWSLVASVPEQPC